MLKPGYSSLIKKKNYYLFRIIKTVCMIMDLMAQHLVNIYYKREKLIILLIQACERRRVYESVLAVMSKNIIIILKTNLIKLFHYFVLFNHSLFNLLLILYIKC